MNIQINKAKSILSEYWGYPNFRPNQESVVKAVLEGKDTLALLPTGGGKSICFQVPALVMEGICIVVSPLIALMKDQVAQLNDRGIRAEALISGISPQRLDIILDNCIYGKIKFLYLSPERLQSSLVMERIAKMKVNLIAIDEAHCISQWGYDFRPQYLNISLVRDYHPNIPILALTATATEIVANDIEARLNFRTSHTIRMSFFRSNLAYMVFKEEDKLNRLLRIIRFAGGSGLVYVRSRKRTYEIAKWLKNEQVNADYYHAGLPRKLRDDIQERWTSGATDLIVATNAFGMGIDKSDVRYVVHMDLPNSPEAYFQEAGRAGRDEKKAYAVLLYQQEDINRLEDQFLKHFPEGKEIRYIYQKLANYYQLAIGSETEQDFGFDFEDFAKKTDLDETMINHCLQALEYESYIEISSGFQKKSLIKFRSNQQQLYSIAANSPVFEPLIQYLLRKNEGIFEELCPISEKQIASQIGMSLKKLNGQLRQLQQMNTISYINNQQRARLKFLTPRQDAKFIHIDMERLRNKQKQTAKRVHAMIQYVAEDNVCRSRMLLHYFDERPKTDCGHCDYCIRQNSANKKKVFSTKLKALAKAHSQSSIQTEEILKSFDPADEKTVLQSIREAIDEGWLVKKANILKIRRELLS